MSDFDNDGDWGADDNGGDWGDDLEQWGDDSLGENDSQVNPNMPKAADAAEHSPPVVDVKGAQESKAALVAKFDSQGRPFVCCRVKVVNGKPVQLEEWRRPTPDEYNAIMFNSKKVVMENGVAAENVPTTTNFNQTTAMVPLGEAQSPVKKYLKWGAGLTALGLIGYFGYKAIKKD